MNLAFDAKRAFCNASGLGNHSRTLLRSFGKYFPQHNYQLYTPKNKGRFKDFPSAFIHTNTSLLPDPLWRSLIIPRLYQNKNADLFHGLSHELPLTRSKKKIPLVLTIHDLIFLKRPELYSSVDRFFYVRKIEAAIKKADAIISISETTKDDVLHFFPKAAPKLTVIYQGCDEKYFDEPRQEPLSIFPGSYMLFAGTVEKRKDVLTILRALKSSQAETPLIVAGKETAYMDELKKYIAEHNLESRVQFAGRVTDRQLLALYDHALFLIYPSVTEGWGLPVAEAICRHLPVITTSGTSMEEIAGEAGMFFQPGNHEELAVLMDRMAASPSLRASMKSKTTELKASFHPRVSAQKHMQLYESLIG